MGTVLTAATRPSGTPGAPTKPQLRVAFVVGKFPLVTEVFIIDQIADLIDRGVDVQVFAFEAGPQENISSRYKTYRMAELTHYLFPPLSKVRRALRALPKILRILRYSPFVLPRVFDVFRYDRAAVSLRLLYSVAPFVGRKFDVVHCHFGDIAVVHLPIRAILRSRTPLVTSLYGHDVSSVFQNYRADFYARLKSECSLFYVMSENMRKRVRSQGFPAEKISVLPVGIDLDTHPFSERSCPNDEPVQLLAVGRLVEKKGFGVLLEALAIVRQRFNRRFICSIVGGGPLEEELRDQCRRLRLDDVVQFLGSMTVDRLKLLFPKMHVLVAPSITARSGDME